MSGERATFPQPRALARFSPFFQSAEPANSFGFAAKTLRKIDHLFPDEIFAEILMKNGGKAADLLGLHCAKVCGFLANKRRIARG